MGLPEEADMHVTEIPAPETAELLFPLVSRFLTAP